MKPTKKIIRAALIGAFLGVCGFPALACDVPVFSYALQFWEADTYVAQVFFRGALSDADRLMVKRLSDAANDATRPANIEVHPVNLDETDDAALLAHYETHLGDANPGLLIYYPMNTRIRRPVYAGPLSEAVVERLLDSPARRELMQRLLRGDMAVWVLLESGNRREDRRAAQMLEREIRRMAEVLELPSEDLWVWSDEIDAEPGIRFSMLRLSRDAPEEDMLARMLLGSEADLLDREAAPMAFPIYGRGLILYALVGAGINEWTIADACEFLIGPCSCQVKASNPGTDLLLAINWNSHVRPDPQSGLPQAAGFGDFFERGEEAAARLAALDDPVDPDEAATTALEQADRDETGIRTGWILAAVIPLAAVALGFLLWAGAAGRSR